MTGRVGLSVNTLSPAQPTKLRKRVGRGRGSGIGKTSRKGHKGAKARSGYSLQVGFEGGQMPLKKRIPKYGYWSNTRFRLEYQTVSIGRLLSFIDRGILDASQTITMKHMHDAGVLKVSYPGVKLLSDVRFSTPTSHSWRRTQGILRNYNGLGVMFCRVPSGWRGARRLCASKFPVPRPVRLRW